MENMEYVPDQGVSVEFYKDSVVSQYQSDAAGHPVHVEKDFVRIMNPGSQLSIIEQPVDPIHLKRFPLQWAKYQTGNASKMTGWKLETWPGVNTAQVKTLKHVGVHTVEQLADISDSIVNNLGMGMMELRARAKKAAAAADNNAEAEKRAEENKRLSDELKKQADEMATLKAMMATMMEPKDAAADMPTASEAAAEATADAAASAESPAAPRRGRPPLNRE